MINDYLNNAFFWQKIDTLVLSSDFVLTQDVDSEHSRYPNLVYPVQYGYLKNDESSDFKISVYRGTKVNKKVDAIAICVDILKKDFGIKLLLGCNEKEEEEILEFLNQTDFQKSVLIRRGNDIPSWSLTEY